MFASLVQNGLSIRSIADVLSICKKLILMIGKRTPDARLRNDLERLALSAPHMLADIGFEREAAACGPHLDVWRRQGTSVVIQSSSTTSVTTL